jgi:ATP-dependent HslUV protease ATP-binding subunit HslU
VSFQASDATDKHVLIDAAYVRGRLADILKREDLSKYIL